MPEKGGVEAVHQVKVLGDYKHVAWYLQEKWQMTNGAVGHSTSESPPKPPTARPVLITKTFKQGKRPLWHYG
jgi:hypothetical protein